MGEKMPGGSGPSAGAARLLFWISASSRRKPGIKQRNLLFGATCLLKLQRQFLARTLVPRPSNLKLPLRRRLLRPHSSYRNFSLEIILGANRCACNSAKHRDLAHVRQRIGYRTLKQPVGGCIERRIRREVIVKRLQRRKEPLGALVPRSRRRVMPFLLSLRHRQ